MEKFKTLKDHVYDYIADQIRKDKLKPGERINENIISDELNISRTPVREALIQLSAEGILENRSRKGFVVKSITLKDITELYAIIGLLDGYAAKLACDMLSQQDINDMSFYIDAMDLAISNYNLDMYYKQQLSFHQIYIDKCGNDLIISQLSQYKKQLLKTSYNDESIDDIQSIFSKTNNEHRVILQYFIEKDKDKIFNYILETHWSTTYASFDVI